jgi:hypothetical protein
MRRLTIPALLLLCGMPFTQIVCADDEDDGDLPPCKTIAEGLDGSCTITPDTSADAPSGDEIDAPDGCYIWDFYDDWEIMVGYACA